jgi:DNA-directed RNA polymerase subunit RPC12/RpoP
MAHWIVDYHGFGGTYYRCSECGEVYWDILDHGCGGDTCLRCGSPMDEDETVYMKNGRVDK